jgi:Fe-S cluster assembly protein SufD
MTAAVRSLRTAAEEGFLRELADAVPPGFREKRAAAAALVEARGLPHRRLEEWKYSDLRAAWRELKPPPAPAAARAVPAGAFPGFSAPRVALVDGVATGFDAVRLPKGVEVRSLAEALGHGDRLLEAHFGRLEGEPDGVVALNTALAGTGAVVHVDAGVEAGALELDMVATGADFSLHPRLLVVLGDGASLTLVESQRGPAGGGHQVNAVAEIVLGKGASLTHVALQAMGERAIVVQSAFVELAAEAAYRTFALEEGAEFARRQVFVRFAGEGARLDLAGATLATRRQHLDTTLRVDHAVPGCDSKETYKYVLGGEATGVFQGKIIVRPDAQKTDGRMSARGLLLDDGAEFDAKPELEIYADDVQCAHGATAGELDEDLMFYLRARGIPEPEAKALLVQAFVGEAVETVEDEALRAALEARIEAWLARAL